MNDHSSRYEFLLGQALECAELGQYEKTSQLLRDAMKLRFDPRLARALDLVQIAMIRQEPSVRLAGTLGPLLNPMESVESTLSAPIQRVVRPEFDDSREFQPLDEEDVPSEGSLDLPVGEDPLNAPSMISFDDLDDLELFQSEVSHDAVTAIAAAPGPPDASSSRPGTIRPGPPPIPPQIDRSPPPEEAPPKGGPTPERGSLPPERQSQPTSWELDGQAGSEEWARPAPLHAEPPASRTGPGLSPTPAAGTPLPDTDPRRLTAGRPSSTPHSSSEGQGGAATPTSARPTFAKTASAEVFRLIEHGRFEDAMARLDEAKGGERDNQWDLLREHVESIWLSSLRRRLSPLSRTVQPAVHPSRLRYLGLDALEAHVMSQLDGMLTIEDVVDISGQGELAGLRLVDRLMGRNLVRLR